MRQFILFATFCLSALCMLQGGQVHAKVGAAKYGLVLPPAAYAHAGKGLDSIINVHPQLAHQQVFVAITPARVMEDKTMDFYFIVFLCMVLGLIRITDPRYFQNLWRAFRNPTLSARQLKDQMEVATFQGLLMNVFFTMVMGAYLYYIVKMYSPQRPGDLPPSLLITMLIGGMMVIYLIKYAVMRFSGWAFKVQGVTDHYTFNVFLINKVLGVLLLPITILLAFADPSIAGPAAVVSFIVIGLLLVNRYTRSWQVLGSFFQYSKFHFFTYLCASELLPLAVLTKLLLR